MEKIEEPVTRISLRALRPGKKNTSAPDDYFFTGKYELNSVLPPGSMLPVGIVLRLRFWQNWMTPLCLCCYTRADGKANGMIPFTPGFLDRKSVV